MAVVELPLSCGVPVWGDVAGKGSIMQVDDDVVAVNTDPVFKGDMAVCEEYDWRPTDGGNQPSLRCREHTVLTGT